MWVRTCPTKVIQAGLNGYLSDHKIQYDQETPNRSMYTVYVLKDSFNKFYKGMTNNLSRRLKEHNSGQTITTSKMKNLNLVYKEEYDNFEDVRKRELYFKSAAGRRFLKQKLNNIFTG